MARIPRSICAVLVGSVLSLVSAFVVAAPPLSGAIFTTDVNGQLVNGNVQYAAQCDVYLDGGPGPNAPQKAAGLPDGNYYYQVTDPSGKKLLSNDAAQNRCFTVTDGIITNQCAVPPVHGVGPSADHGGLTIQLCPYDRTPNPGGVYKVWATPVGDFVGDPTDTGQNNCGNGCFHGFLPAASKTDNFKVGAANETFCLRAYKYTIDNKKGFVPVAGWEVFFGGNTLYTGSDGMVEICGLVAGTYSIEESAVDGSGNPYLVLYSYVNGQEVQPPSTALTVSVGKNNDPNPAVVEWVNIPDTKK